MAPILGIIASGNWAGANASSYESIATTVLSGNASTVTFSSIPSTYTHLQLRYIARENWNIYTAGSTLSFYVNGDTGNNFARHQVSGNGSSASSANITSTSQQAFGYIPGGGAGASIFGAGIVDILDYANTNKYKTFRSLAGNDTNGAGYIGLFSDLWLNTNAITSITLVADQNFVQYSHFALYGIKG